MFSTNQIKDKYLYKQYTDRGRVSSPDDPQVTHTIDMSFGGIPYTILLSRKPGKDKPFRTEILAAINRKTGSNDLNGVRRMADSAEDSVREVQYILGRSDKADNIIGWKRYKVEYQLYENDTPLVDYFNDENLDEVLVKAEKSGARFIGVYSELNGKIEPVAWKTPDTGWNYRLSNE